MQVILSDEQGCDAVSRHAGCDVIIAVVAFRRLVLFALVRPATAGILLIDPALFDELPVSVGNLDAALRRSPQTQHCVMRATQTVRLADSEIVRIEPGDLPFALDPVDQRFGIALHGGADVGRLRELTPELAANTQRIHARGWRGLDVIDSAGDSLILMIFAC